MRTRWTTDPGADARLVRVFPGIRADAVVGTVVGGVPVYVTATEAHYDGDCDRPDAHDCAAADVQVWDAATGDLVRTVRDAGGRHLAVAVVGGRPVAVTCDWSDTPKSIDLDAGVVSGGITGHEGIVQGATAASGQVQRTLYRPGSVRRCSCQLFAVRLPSCTPRKNCRLPWCPIVTEPPRAVSGGNACCATPMSGVHPFSVKECARWSRTRR